MFRGEVRRVFEILLVEDNPADVRLTEEALNETGVQYRLRVASDGAKAVELLRDEHASRPDLILLDWNLPRMDGRDVLREIKEDTRLRELPVIVLTTSRAPADIARAYDLHANCFITKPVNVLHFFDAIKAVQEFWLETATLPGV